MSLLDWLWRNRRVTFERDPRLMAYRVTVQRAGGEIVRREICDEQLVASRLPVIELVQTLFEHPVDRLAIGLAFRRDWFQNEQARAMISAGARSAPRAPDRGEWLETARSERVSPAPIRSRTKPPVLGTRNPQLPIYEPR